MGLSNKCFLYYWLLADLVKIVNAPVHIKCIFLKSQQSMTIPTLINLYTNEYIQESHFYLFGFTLDRFIGSCNTLNDLSNRVCVPNKSKDLSLRAFNVTTEWINE